MRRGRRMLSAVARRMRCWLLSFGNAVECPICEWTGSAFLRHRLPNKPADFSLCPSCGSFERHRFAFVALKDILPLCATRALHFAPEQCMEPWLRRISTDYLSVDLMSPRAMEKMDITALRLENGSATLIWCSHVLEHIEADRVAMSELFRVLKPDGKAILMVPIYGSSTYENPDVQSPGERLKHFKQEDHVRLYGLDFAKRLEEAGFEVQVLRTADLPAETCKVHGLEYPSTNEIFVCVKPGGDIEK